MSAYSKDTTDGESGAHYTTHEYEEDLHPMLFVHLQFEHGVDGKTEQHDVECKTEGVHGGLNVGEVFLRAMGAEVEEGHAIAEVFADERRRDGEGDDVRRLKPEQHQDNLVGRPIDSEYASEEQEDGYPDGTGHCWIKP